MERILFSNLLGWWLVLASPGLGQERAVVLPERIAQGHAEPASVPEAATSQRAVGSGVECRWFGHGFIYLTSESGVRVALDPFDDGAVGYDFPINLAADVVLISSESADRSGGIRLSGNPQLFRSVAGVGSHRANGIIFRGIRTYRDGRGGRDLGSNTVYAFELDRIRFVYLGGLGHRLTKAQVNEIGRADVLFVSVGNPLLKSAEWHRAVEDLRARWVVPIAYRTAKSGPVEALPLDEIDLKDYPFRKVPSNMFTFSRDSLPDKATLLLLEAP